MFPALDKAVEMVPKIISIGFSVPELSHTQEEIFNILGYPRPFYRLFKGCGIEKRHFWINPLSRIKQMTWQEMSEEYFKGSIELSKQAIDNCLDGRDAKEIGCVIFCSCTGYCPGPSIAHYLAKEIGFNPGTYFNNIMAQGCESGFPGIKRAYDFAISTGKTSLVIACEVCWATYFPEPDGKPDPENDYELLRANAIFADAASAALVGFDDDPKHPCIVDTESYFNPDYINDLGYTWRDGRLRVLLSKRVPRLAPQVVKPAVQAVLRRQGLDILEIQWFVIHAAGNVVLDNIRDELGIAEEKMRLSRETLWRFGNTSSTSVGITGKRLMSQDIKTGDYAAVLSVGPGMTGGITLLQWNGLSAAASALLL